MRITVSSLRLPLGREIADLPNIAAACLGIQSKQIKEWKILRRSLDARGRREPSFICSIGMDVQCEDSILELPCVSPWPQIRNIPIRCENIGNLRPVIVGFGPAGMFAALRLLERGAKPIVLEGGAPVEERLRDVAGYWRKNLLNPESNVQFGEGGAGTFSDGKLTYRGKDPRKSWVFEKLIAAGAPEEILFEAKPHLGTDRLRGIVRYIRKVLLEAGCDVRFNTRVRRLILKGNAAVGVETEREQIHGAPVFLAPGHSARNFIREIASQGVAVEAKSFAMGLRVELPQSLVDKRQYGKWADSPRLPRAEFSIASHSPELRDVYSFCMCPGGSIIPAGSEPDGLVVNGMSGAKRGGKWANAALVAPVAPADFNGSALEGFDFQRKWEREALRAAGNGTAPAQMFMDFLERRVSDKLPRSSCPWPLASTQLDNCLPTFVSKALRNAAPALLRKLDILSQGLLIGVETRTSSPVRITRDAGFKALGLLNLYPIGEGSGYAGGIVSCAVDGVKAVDTFIAEMNNSAGIDLFLKKRKY